MENKQHTEIYFTKNLKYFIVSFYFVGSEVVKSKRKQRNNRNNNSHIVVYICNIRVYMYIMLYIICIYVYKKICIFIVYIVYSRAKPSNINGSEVNKDCLLLFTVVYVLGQKANYFFLPTFVKG